MNALVRKEIRLLLPFWGIAMFLAIVPSLIVPRPSYADALEQIIFWPFGFGAVLLGLAPFGQEFSLGTFSSLMAQPTDRRRVWATKTFLVTLGGLLMLVAFALAIHLRFGLSMKDFAEQVARRNWVSPETPFANSIQANKLWYASEFWKICRFSALVMFVAITGASWTTLLFRQTGAALWFAILIPAAISILIQWFVPSSSSDIILWIVMIVYSVAGFFRARSMFLQAQDSQWLGETISVLSLSSSKPQAESDSPRRLKPVATLLRKEFQSHQITLIIAFGVLMFHACTLVIRKFYNFSSNSELRFAFEATPFLWLLMPWLIGGVAVAEERKLGTLESQLCLPVTRRLQFAIKFTVVVLLGLVLGGFMPCLIETAGVLAGVRSEILKLPFAADFGLYFATVAEVTIAATSIAIISFFASTLTRNTLHALGAAFVFGGIFWALFIWVMVGSHYSEYAPWRGPLILIIGITVLLIAVLSLSFSNYKTLHAGRNVWLRNLLILFSSLAFAGLAAAVVYQRPWELAMSLEPHHGAPHTSGPIRPTIALSGSRAVALLPDGRLWAATDFHLQELNRYQDEWDSENQIMVSRKQKVPIPGGGIFIGSSNWVALAANDSFAGVAALQSDGTLWSILSWEDTTNHFHRSYWLNLVPAARRIGADSDWKSVAAGQGYFFAVKTNGTLWGWGANSEGRLAPDSRDRIDAPVQIGTDSDWAGLFGRGQSVLVVKDNGDIWDWVRMAHDPIVKLAPRNLNGADWVTVAGGFQDIIVIRRDGTLWVRPNGYGRQKLFGTVMPISHQGKLVRIGQDSDWAQISGWISDDVFAVKKDGRLVKNGTELFGSTLGQPSQYSDWLALTAEWEGTMALASDGTISLWMDTRSGSDLLLAPTHRPLWSLNIFSNSNP
jgi:alpha-tubulin suppressor-like RCC1 family protein